MCLLKRRPRSSALFYSQLLCTDVKAGQWRKPTGNKLIHLKYDVKGDIYAYPELQKDRKVVFRSNQAWTLFRRRNDWTESEDQIFDSTKEKIEVKIK